MQVMFLASKSSVSAPQPLSGSLLSRMPATAALPLLPLTNLGAVRMQVRAHLPPGADALCPCGRCINRRHETHLTLIAFMFIEGGEHWKPTLWLVRDAWLRGASLVWRETPVSHVGGLDRSSSAWLAVCFGGSGRSWGLKKQSRVDPPRVSHAADAGATSGARATGPAETQGPVALIAPSMAGIKDEVESPLGLWDPLQTVEHRGLCSLWKETRHQTFQRC